MKKYKIVKQRIKVITSYEVYIWECFAIKILARRWWNFWRLKYVPFEDIFSDPVKLNRLEEAKEYIYNLENLK